MHESSIASRESAPRRLRAAERLQKWARAVVAALTPYRWWLAVWVPLACWFAHPLWSARLLPLHDLPNHLARITALHYVADPRWNLAAYYQRSLQLVPYVGHFLLVHWLAYPLRSVITANIVFMTAYVLSAPLCGLMLARATGRSPWLAFFLLPLSVSLYFQWGFISSCAGAADRCGEFDDLPQSALHTELARRRAYLHPYRWTSLGLALLEAMYLAMPVVVLAATEAPLAVPPGAGAISTSPAELAAALRRFLRDPQAARAAGQAAREAACTRYSLKRFLHDWDEVLQEACR